jgi:peptidoglycan/LPS O-acetylase OafA/YrhL
MNKGFSTYLDLLRISAAGLVFGHHVLMDARCYSYSSGGACYVGTTLIPYRLGHYAVVLFFVLSGYVITYVVAERESTLTEYAVSRVARIYSVAIPALILTMCIDSLFISIGAGSEWIPTYQYRHIWKYLPIFLTFTTDFWFLGESTFSDGVFWSLCYEVWYYILFAAVFYFAGWRRWALASLILLLVGYKLWALLPIWVLGSLAYQLHGKYAMPPAAARLLMLSSLALLLIFYVTGTSGVDRLVDGLSGGWIATHMRYSQWFVGDTIIAFVFVINVFAANYARLEFGRLASLIKLFASFTFTLYLMHGPLLAFWMYYVESNVVQAIVVVLASVVLLGMATEHQNHRLRRLLVTGYSVLPLHLCRKRNPGSATCIRAAHAVASAMPPAPRADDGNEKITTITGDT